jgi:hypothetical protein
MMNSSWFNLMVTDLDGNIKHHKFNATTLNSAKTYAQEFCTRFGFKFLALIKEF